VITFDDVPVHPFDVPVTVYVVVAVGFAVIDEETPPVLHEYEVAPVADNVTVPPGQIEPFEGFDVIVMEGAALTVIA